MTTSNQNNSEITVGSKVNYISGNFMKNGLVYGLDLENNRAFVKWEHQGNSSIRLTNLVLTNNQ